MAELEPKVLVVFYSFTGKTAEFAHAVVRGAEKVTSQVILRRVPEIFPEGQIPVPIRQIEHGFANVPLATAKDMVWADGILLGSPTHFSAMAAQLKQFLDQFGPIWNEGKLIDKVVGAFTSAGSLHGGEEIALQSMLMTAIGMGMIPVGIPYPIKGVGPEFDAGSPFGAIYYSGHEGERTLSAADRLTAELLGERVAHVAQAILVSQPKHRHHGREG